MFFHASKHVAGANGGMAWPKGGSITLATNMAAKYMSLGGEIVYNNKVVRILTKDNRACGIELDDGTVHEADYVVSNADGRKTIEDMLNSKYMNKKMKSYCESKPDELQAFAVQVYLGIVIHPFQRMDSVIIIKW